MVYMAEGPWPYTQGGRESGSLQGAKEGERDVVVQNANEDQYRRMEGEV